MGPAVLLSVSKKYSWYLALIWQLFLRDSQSVLCLLSAILRAILSPSQPSFQKGNLGG